MSIDVVIIVRIGIAARDLMMFFKFFITIPHITYDRKCSTPNTSGKLFLAKRWRRIIVSTAWHKNQNTFWFVFFYITIIRILEYFAKITLYKFQLNKTKSVHLNCSKRWKDHNLKDILYDQLSKGQVHFGVFSPLCACCACMCVYVWKWKYIFYDNV